MIKENYDSKEKPVVSIVIPVYNVESYLEECVESARNQTLKNIEIILVDDGSTDASGKMCDMYAEKDTRIKVIHKKNGGLSEARNTGAEDACGNYIYFLDSDDWIEPYAMESLYSYAEKDKLELVLFDARVVDEDGCDYLETSHYMRYCRIGNYEGVYTGIDIFKKMVDNKEHFSSVPLLFIKRKVFTMKFENILHEDELFTIKLLYRTQRVSYYPEMLYVRRIRRGSIMTVVKSEQHYIGMKTVVDEILDLPNRDEAIYRYACTLLQCTELIYNALNKNERKKVKNDRRKLMQKIKINNYYNNRRLKCITHCLKIYPIYNSLFNKENSFCSKLLKRIQQNNSENKLMKNLHLSDFRRYFIMGVPTHGNLGDHAISIAQLKLLSDMFEENEIIEIDRATYKHKKRKLMKIVSKKDIIVIPGGGWLGNQWYHNEKMVEDVIKTFKDNKVIILPQTIYFEQSKDQLWQINNAKECFSNKKLLFALRDMKSYEFCKKEFKTRNVFCPDLVLSLSSKYQLTRSGVLLCFRDDCEKEIAEGEKNKLIKWINEKFKNIKYTTTVIGHVSISKRQVAVGKKLREFSRAQLVITDRLHAMIFAAITGTPCVAFDNSSNKVSGVCQWLKHLEYIKVVASFTEAQECICSLIDKKNNQYVAPSFEELKKEILNFVNE